MSYYYNLRPPVAKVKAIILDHPEFIAFKQSAIQLFVQWKQANIQQLKGFDKDGLPKALIETISENLLATFKTAQLLDAYAMYQHLMDYWADTMQDDCYIIAADGWIAETYRIREEVKSGKNKGEERDKGWACDLVPKPLIVARYFAEEQAAIEALQAELEGVTVSLDELIEEHGGEEGVLKDVSSKADAQEAYKQAVLLLWHEEDELSFIAYHASIDTAYECAIQLQELSDQSYLSVLRTAKGKLTLKAIKDRLTTLSGGEEHTVLSDYLETEKKQKKANKKAEELFKAAADRFLAQIAEEPLPEKLYDLHATVRYLKLVDQQATLKAEIKEAEATLDQLAYEKYPQLTQDEVKTLVVNDKWLTTLDIAIQGELDRVSQSLAGRIYQLAERYAVPLPKLVDEVNRLAARVEGHLRKMGAAC